MRDGPDHYTRLKPEPIDVINAWGLNFNLGNVVKYVARWDAKGGIDDLRKARQYLDFEIYRLERPEPAPPQDGKEPLLD